MATRLYKAKEIVRGNPHLNAGKPNGVRYPWAKWFSWVGVTLIQDKDFTCTIRGMDYNIRQAARRLGFRVAVSCNESKGTVTMIVKGKVKDTATNGKSSRVK